MASADFALINGLWYLFYPRRYPNAAGVPHLDVLMPELTFDVQGRASSLTFEAVVRQRLITPITIRHGAHHDQETYQMCAGRISLFGDHVEPMEIFTFGGSLSIIRRERSTLCEISSPAPLIPLQLLYPHSPPMRLVHEVEALLASRRLAWGCDPGAYEQRLAHADPLILYCACLQRLSLRHNGIYLDAERDSAQEFTRFLYGEIRALQTIGDWPAYLCPLEDVV